ncbi:MAG: transglycosylase SLT domain-containing protein [Chloroflexi bacterium]|nr:transglycosylase SLT domain-containing protein [Chloroflexota bacterium]
MLRCLVSVATVCTLVLPGPAFAFDEQAGSPPDWDSYWVQTLDRVDLFVHADGDASFGQAPSGLFFRVDAPELNGRLWVYNPLDSGWAWLPTSGTERVAEPTPDDVAASVPSLSPRDYLYHEAPDLAPRLDCIIAGESGWDPRQQNPRSHAAGLAQFLPTTWASTPEGQAGLSPYEPTANIDAAIWLARTRGWTQWQIFTQGRCR